jgi:MYXO-CTERM domain-containing protein
MQTQCQEGKNMRYLVMTLAFFLVSVSAHAVAAPHGPSPEMDFGLASLVMVAGAAFLAARRRR